MRRPIRSPFHRPAMQTLERLHSELGGRILENKTEALRLVESMRHVEAVIKMLDPRRQPNPWFKRGTVYRRAVDVRRTATEPLDGGEIAEFGGCERHRSEQGRAGGPCRERLGLPAEPQGQGNRADQQGSACAVAIERGRQLRRPYRLARTGST
jgi:hypothetical protein